MIVSSGLLIELAKYSVFIIIVVSIVIYVYKRRKYNKYLDKLIEETLQQRNPRRYIKRIDEKDRIANIEKNDFNVQTMIRKIIKSKIDLRTILTRNEDYGMDELNEKRLIKWKKQYEDIIDFYGGYGSIVDECIYLSKKDALNQLENQFDEQACLKYVDDKFGIDRNLVFWDGPSSGGIKFETCGGKYKELYNEFYNIEKQLTPGSNKGYVYILINDSYEGLVKIGKTTRTVEERIKELSSHSGVPSPFKIAYHKFVSNCSLVEEQTHIKLHEFRYKKNREFFKISTMEAIKCINTIINDLS
jgi:hypothetical protein